LDSLLFGGVLLTLIIMPVQSYAAQFGQIMTLLLLLLWAVQVAVRREIIVVWTPIHFVLLVFLALALVQLTPLPWPIHALPFTPSFEGLPVRLDEWRLTTLDPSTTAKIAAMLAALIGYLFIAVHAIDREKRLRRTVNVLIFVGFTIAVLGLLNRLSPSNEPLLARAGPFGLYYHQAQYVGFIEMIFPLPLAMSFARGVRRDQVLLYGFAGIVMGVVLATSGMTGGVLILVIELMTLPLLLGWQRAARGGRERRFSKVWALVGAAAVAASIIGGMLWISARSIPQMVSTDVSQEVQAVSNSESNQTYYTRLMIWRTTWRMFTDHPILGVGLGAAPIGYTRYDPAPGRLEVNATHNDYLQIVGETGAVGGVILILFLIFLARLSKTSLIKGERLERSVALGATVACVGILVHSVVDFYLQSPANAWMFFTLIALLISAQRVPEKY
jgi:O-antigen ligase